VAAGYGRVEVLRGLDLAVPTGSVVALLGPNGAGKTTTLRAISGTIPIRRGSVRLDSRRVDGRSAYHIARSGILLVPEGRGIFPTLTVLDNLRIAARATPGIKPQERSDHIDRVLQTFPKLELRIKQHAGRLSGGEQQMLAISRALLAEPKVLMMDEISMGLAPIVVDQLFEIVAGLKESGMTMVIVEQYLTHALRVADVCYVMARGRIAFVGEPAELADGDAVARTYLGAETGQLDGGMVMPTSATTGRSPATKTRNTRGSSDRLI
jgi:branched-chain amino acid transport system ATP-binding protein